MTTKKEFLQAVEHEVRMLKQYATEEELSRLDFSTFLPDMTDQCIYGQMTGDCGSRRSVELLEKSCIKVLEQDSVDDFDCFKEIKKGISNEGMKGRRGPMVYSYLSALETYILLKTSRPENIIKFLKGETDKLKL